MQKTVKPNQQKMNSEELAKQRAKAAKEFRITIRVPSDKKSTVEALLKPYAEQITYEVKEHPSGGPPNKCWIEVQIPKNQMNEEGVLIGAILRDRTKKLLSTGK